MPANGANPYARPTSPGTGAAPDPSGKFRLGGPGRYSVPDIPNSTNPEYTDGFSPALTSGSTTGDTFPDNIRTGARKPPVNDPNNLQYSRRRYGESLFRQSAEQWRPGRTRVRQQKPEIPVIPDQVQEKLPTRPTASMAPTDNLMTRPWHIPRNAADAIGPGVPLHISMADHRRNYAIFTMQPRGGVGTNTYRPTPRPWDAELFVPPQPVNTNNPGVFGPRRFGL